MTLCVCVFVCTCSEVFKELVVSTFRVIQKLIVISRTLLIANVELILMIF
jgi:hypothetical protein